MCVHLWGIPATGVPLWFLLMSLALCVIGTGTCTNDPAFYSGYGEQRCPSRIGKYLVPVLMGVYVLITNVLLLNLLIAMFRWVLR